MKGGDGQHSMAAISKFALHSAPAGGLQSQAWPVESAGYPDNVTFLSRTKGCLVLSFLTEVFQISIYSWM